MSVARYWFGNADPFLHFMSAVRVGVHPFQRCPGACFVGSHVLRWFASTFEMYYGSIEHPICGMGKVQLISIGSAGVLEVTVLEQKRLGRCVSNL